MAGDTIGVVFTKKEKRTSTEKKKRSKGGEGVGEKRRGAENENGNIGTVNLSGKESRIAIRRNIGEKRDREGAPWKKKKDRGKKKCLGGKRACRSVGGAPKRRNPTL